MSRDRIWDGESDPTCTGMGPAPLASSETLPVCTVRIRLSAQSMTARAGPRCSSTPPIALPSRMVRGDDARPGTGAGGTRGSSPTLCSPPSSASTPPQLLSIHFPVIVGRERRGWGVSGRAVGPPHTLRPNLGTRSLGFISPDIPSTKDSGQKGEGGNDARESQDSDLGPA